MKNEKKGNSTHASTHPCMHHHIGSKRNHNMSCIIKSSLILHKIIENHFQKNNKEIWKKKGSNDNFFV